MDSSPKWPSGTLNSTHSLTTRRMINQPLNHCSLWSQNTPTIIHTSSLLRRNFFVFTWKSSSSSSSSSSLTTQTDWSSPAYHHTHSQSFNRRQRQRQITIFIIVGPLTTHSSGSGHSTPVPMVLSRQWAYTPALQLGALNDVGSRPQFSQRHLPFASVTHFLHGLLLIYRTQKDERLSWPYWLALLADP